MRTPAYVPHDQTDSITLPDRTLRALDEVDKMPPELRGCVHEFGFAIVDACVKSGISRPQRIRQLVYQIWQGARQPHQRSGVGKGAGAAAEDYLDWVLLQAGANITAARLVRVLYDKGLVVIPHEPSDDMVVTSMMAIEGMGVMTKRKKHSTRLRAAIRAGVRQFWPGLMKEKA